MKATYWQRGEALDYKNDTTSTIAENTVVAIKTRIGITGNAIEPGQTGSLHVCGVFALPKAESEAIEMGTLLYYTEDGITTQATGNIPAGYAAKASVAEEVEVLVKLLG